VLLDIGLGSSEPGLILFGEPVPGAAVPMVEYPRRMADDFSYFVASAVAGWIADPHRAEFRRRGEAACE